MLRMIKQFLQRLYYGLLADRNTRDIFYRVMGAQVRAGLSIERSVEQAAMAIGENEVAKTFGKRLKRMRYSGRMVTQDWRESNVLPAVDAELLVIAERNGQLPEMFAALSDRITQSLGIFHMVVRPNFYYVFAAGGATAFLMGFADFLELIAGRYPEILEGQMSYQMSLFMRKWIWGIGFGFAGLVIFAKLISEYAPKTVRRIFKLLVIPYDNVRAAQYLNLSKQLAKQGATFTKNVEVSLRVLGSTSPYFKRGLEEVARGLKRGDDYMQLIKDRLVPKEIASILQGLAPASKRNLLAPAFETAEIILIERMRSKYASFKTLMLLLLILYAAGTIGMLVLGMYDTTAQLTDVVGRR